MKLIRMTATVLLLLLTQAGCAPATDTETVIDFSLDSAPVTVSETADPVADTAYARLREDAAARESELLAALDSATAVQRELEAQLAEANAQLAQAQAQSAALQAKNDALMQEVKALQEPAAIQTEAETAGNSAVSASEAYIINVDSRKFHLPTCSSAAQIKPENRASAATREDAVAQGCEPCGRCKP